MFFIKVAIYFSQHFRGFLNTVNFIQALKCNKKHTCIEVESPFLVEMAIHLHYMNSFTTTYQMDWFLCPLALVHGIMSKKIYKMTQLQVITHVSPRRTVNHFSTFRNSFNKMFWTKFNIFTKYSISKLFQYVGFPTKS